MATKEIAEKVATLGWEQLVDKAMDKAGNVFEAVSNVIGKAASDYGPSVVDAVLWVIRIDHIQPLIYGGITLIALLTFWIVFGSKMRKHFIEHDRDIEQIDVSMGIVTVIGTLASLFFCIPFIISTLFNVWNWTAVVKPELWIAKQVVVKIERMANQTEKK